jgi:hypothetical protein
LAVLWKLTIDSQQGFAVTIISPVLKKTQRRDRVMRIATTPGAGRHARASRLRAHPLPATRRHAARGKGCAGNNLWT